MSHRKEKRRIANGGLPTGAVPADTSKQIPVSPYGSTKKFYVDIAFKCSDCGSDEIWTAEQQKWFYEDAKGSLYARAKRCRDCRNRLADVKALQRRQMADSGKTPLENPDP